MVFLHSHGVGTARAVRIFKTYGADAVQVMTVSSNSFDVMGAKRFGLQVAWVRRSRPQAVPADAGPTDMFKALRLRGEILGTEPDHVRGSLTGLAGLR